MQCMHALYSRAAQSAPLCCTKPASAMHAALQQEQWLGAARAQIARAHKGLSQPHHVGMDCGVLYIQNRSLWKAFLSFRPGCQALTLCAWFHAAGYPWIDAGMRQLSEWGWMHHLVRHSVACFLTRGDLYLSWEEGKAVFEELLLDAVSWGTLSPTQLLQLFIFLSDLLCLHCKCPSWRQNKDS